MRGGPGDISESEAESCCLILHEPHHLKTPQIKDLLHWGDYPCLSRQEGIIIHRSHIMIDSSLYPHEFLYAGVVYLEYGSSRWQTNVLLDISSAPTIHIT